MSITIKDIQAKKTKIDNGYSYEVRLLIDNDNRITSRQVMAAKDKKKFDDEIFYELSMSLIAHIYGDLIDPINTLASIIKANPDVDKELFSATMEKIGGILKGKYEEPKKKSPIILN